MKESQRIFLAFMAASCLSSIAIVLVVGFPTEVSPWSQRLNAIETLAIGVWALWLLVRG